VFANDRRALEELIRRAEAPGDGTHVDLNRAAHAIEEFLRALDLDPATHAELGQTGRLVAATFAHDLLGGYALDPRAVLADTMPGSEELVLVRNIATTVMCPHHLLPAQGVVHLAYVPHGRLAGLGALARLVDCFSRRLVLQETMTRHVAEALVEHLGAAAAGCIADLSPACLTARGERRHDARVVSLATAGDPDVIPRIESLLAPLAAATTEARAAGPTPT
jgi:GTP cyclohydrolase I